MKVNLVQQASTHLLVITTNDLVAGALKMSLGSQPGIEVHTCPCANHILHLKHLNHTPEVILMDDTRLTSIFILSDQLRLLYPTAKYIYLSNDLNPIKVALACRNHFHAVLSFQDRLMDRLLDIIERVLLGKTYYSETAMQAYQDFMLNRKMYSNITPARVRILNMMFEGCTPQEIAEKCKCTVHAVYQHQSKLRLEFDAKDNTDLIIKVKAMLQWNSNEALAQTVQIT